MKNITAQSPCEQVKTLSLITGGEAGKGTLSIQGEICINQDWGPGGH